MIRTKAKLRAYETNSTWNVPVNFRSRHGFKFKLGMLFERNVIHIKSIPIFNISDVPFSNCSMFF